MQATEFADEIFRLWPKAFQPREQWERELVDAVTEFSVSQLEGALKALKLRRAGRALDLQSVVDACRSVPSMTALPGKSVAFNREPGAYIIPFRDWLRARGLNEQYHRLPMQEQVMISRLCAVLWGGSQWEAEADRIAGEGKPWDRLTRLYDRAIEAPECSTTSARGWFAPWADKSRVTSQ